MLAGHLEALFPALPHGGYSVESPPTEDYNCIAWAAGDTERWWWPLPPFAYWPPNVPRATTLAAFGAAFQTLGYEICGTSELEDGFEKVVIYATEDGAPTHMARQLASGVWTSKLGRSEDIIHHTLQALEGLHYGRVVQALRRATARG